jgi:hypothetical protein
MANQRRLIELLGLLQIGHCPKPLFVPAPQIFLAGALIGADRQINLDSSHVDSSSIVGGGRGATADEPARLVSFLLFISAVSSLSRQTSQDFARLKMGVLSVVWAAGKSCSGSLAIFARDPPRLGLTPILHQQC